MRTMNADVDPRENRRGKLVGRTFRTDQSYNLRNFALEQYQVRLEPSFRPLCDPSVKRTEQQCRDGCGHRSRNAADVHVQILLPQVLDRGFGSPERCHHGDRQRCINCRSADDRFGIEQPIAQQGDKKPERDDDDAEAGKCPSHRIGSADRSAGMAAAERARAQEDQARSRRPGRGRPT